MTQTNHTPGPWVTEGLGQSYGLYDPDGCMIGSILKNRQNAGETARLIAAAPDMLDALERAYQKLSFWMDDDKWDHGDEKALELIWAAIAKAKGE